MANSKLSAYWKWRINSATEIEKFNLKFKFKKDYKKDDWTVILIDKSTGLPVYISTVIIPKNEQILPKITQECIRISRMIYEEKTELSKFFNNQYKMWL